MEIQSLRNTSEQQRRWSQKDEGMKKEKKTGGRGKRGDRTKEGKQRKTENDQAICLNKRS